MPSFYKLVACFILLGICTFQPASCINFGIISGIKNVYYYAKSFVTEICDVNAANITGLDNALSSKLYGQPFVRNLVVSSVKNHLENNDPPKALVLSFHGWIGGGKNFVSKMIVESIFPMGFSSKFVKLFVASERFPHDDKLRIYQEQLKEEIVATVYQCERPLFIFDEIDKAPIGLLDVLKPYMDYHPHINGVDFRKAIFIFLSNIGAVATTNYLLDQWVKGIHRNDIQLKELSDTIMKAAYNDDGGLQRSFLISSRLISIFVPFLPLEKEHVKLCIRDILVTTHKHLKVDRDFIDRVADELLYYPEELELYSNAGCKGLVDKINFIYEVEKSYGKTEL